MSKSFETEIAIYAKVTDPSGFSQANHHERQEQWEYKVPAPKGQRAPKMRVRATTVNDRTVYTQTLKNPVGSGKDIAAIQQMQEPTVVINQEYYNVWVDAFGTSGCLKDRYTFITTDVVMEVGDLVVTAPRLRYEVDYFTLADGKKSEWCKIDVELDELLKFINDQHPEIKDMAVKIKISHLPFKPVKGILSTDQDPIRDKVRRDLWDKWNLPKETLLKLRS